MPFEKCAAVTTKSKRLQVHFGDRVGIKQYNIVPGDNPGCSSGVPIQLGWNIESATEHNFYFYEHFRSSERLRGKQLKIPPIERERMLIAAGFTRVDCSGAIERVNVFREERRLESFKNEGWDRFSLLILKQSCVDGLSVKGLVHGTTKGRSGDECTPMLDRFRRSFSLRREKSVGIKFDEEKSSTNTFEAKSDAHEDEGGRGRGRSSSLRRERSVHLGGNIDGGGALLGRSFSLRSERSIDLSSSTKSSTTGFWKKSTGESLQVFQLGNRRPATKSARSA